MLSSVFVINSSIADFIGRAEKQLLWLNREFSRTERGESDRKAIKAARHELLTIIREVATGSEIGSGPALFSGRETTRHALDSSMSHRVSQKYTSSPGPRTAPCIVAHDLTNDLTIIIGQCDLLDERMVEGDATSERLKSIKAAAKRMAERIAARSCPECQVTTPAGAPTENLGVTSVASRR